MILAPSSDPLADPRRIWPLSVVASLLIHAVLILLLWISIDQDTGAPPETKEKSGKTISVTLTPMVAEVPPEEVAPEPIPEPEPPAPEPERFVDTNAQQEAPPAPDTTTIAERDTAAASDAPKSGSNQSIAQQGEKDLPTQDTINRQTQLSDETEPNPETGEATPQTGAETSEIEGAEEPTPPVETTDVPKEVTESEETDVSEPAGSVESFTEKERAQTIEEVRNDEDVSEDPKPAEKVEEKELPKPTPRREIRPKAEDPAFSGHRRKNFREGTIGVAADYTAEDAKGTPLGKYHSQVLALIEREWRLNVNRYRDLILPGQVAITFLVDKNGRAYRIRFLHQLDGGAVQNGFSMGSIRSARLPKMPKEAVRELEGDPLEMLIRFNF